MGQKRLKNEKKTSQGTVSTILNKTDVPKNHFYVSRTSSGKFSSGLSKLHSTCAEEYFGKVFLEKSMNL